MKSISNIPGTSKKRVVIVGAGFAGLKVVRNLISSNDFQIVLLDKNNYHQFQPLFYQVATAGLEPSAISFPLRKVMQGESRVHFRIADVEEVVPRENMLYTNIGKLRYDYLIMSTGVDTNYFGNKNIEENAVPMKSVSEAIFLRNKIIRNYERALDETEPDEVKALMNVVVVGGGPTGVELSGALAEMRRFILPKDYPELDFDLMKVYLLEAGDQLLGGMSDSASNKARDYLKSLGVDVRLNTMVEDFDGFSVKLKDSESELKTYTLIWAAGVSGKQISGFLEQDYMRGNRLIVDKYNLVKGYNNIYALGDACYMETDDYPKGHPQVAQVAIQQAQNLVRNLKKSIKGRQLKEFSYLDKGSLATIGRHLAVADLPFIKFQGFLAWILWLLVHLFSIVGVKNKLVIFLNWAWNYLTYDQSLRLLIIHKTFGKK
ncbi:MAG: NAD(P)/FAD-dependent oxidoreductase [Bacteroidota bacterium]